MDTIENNKLFIGNLHWHVRRPELKEFFGQWGEVEYASVSLDRETKRSRGFGFVTFATAEEAATAKEEANEKELQGRPIYIDFAKARETPTVDEKTEDEETEEQQSEETEVTEEQQSEETEE